MHTFHLSLNLDTPEQVSRRQKGLVTEDWFKFFLESLRVESEATLENLQGMKTYAVCIEIRKRDMAESPICPGNMNSY